MSQPPYSKPYRLNNIIAAIQILGSNIKASQPLNEWVKKLDNPSNPIEWKELFNEHPEFFRVNKEFISLRLRHGYDRIFDENKKRELSNDELGKLTDKQKESLTHRPLTDGQIEALIKTAIELHERGIADFQEKRWLKILLITFGGSTLGGIIVEVLKHFLNSK